MKDFAHYACLNGKTVFVTGGASGIGAGIIKAFAAQDAKVGFINPDRESSENLPQSLEGQHAYAQCDLRDINALKSAFSELYEKLVSALVLVNNAARDERHD